MRDLAQRLLTVEAASQSVSTLHTHEAVRVCEKLRISLTRFAGADGFLSLIRRALALARAEVPALQSVQVMADGRLEGLDEIAAEARHVDSRLYGKVEGALAITTHLLELLVTFIGKPLTLRLLREAWPDAVFDDNLEQSRR